MNAQLAFVLLLKKGEVLYREGEASHSVFAVLSGLIQESHATEALTASTETVNFVRAAYVSPMTGSLEMQCFRQHVVKLSACLWMCGSVCLWMCESVCLWICRWDRCRASD
jgi:hypothetical protein